LKNIQPFALMAVVVITWSCSFHSHYNIHLASLAVYCVWIRWSGCTFNRSKEYYILPRFAAFFKEYRTLFVHCVSIV